MAYAIYVRPHAQRALRRLDPAARKSIAQVIDSLATDPRPAGTRSLVGHRPWLRVRSGDYRVIYAVDDQERLVTVAAAGRRRDIYRNLDLGR